MRQRASETRDHLLDVAEEHFARHGYDATGVAEICAAAGVSKGAFYHHFPTKQALFLHLLNRWLADLDASLNAIHADAGSAVDAIERMSALLQPIFHQERGKLQILFEFWAQAQREPAIWQAVINPYRRYQAFFAGIIREGSAKGAFKVVDPELTAQMLISLAIGLLLQGMMDPDGADWGSIMQASVRLFLQGLVADAEGNA